jgi:Ca2+/Na+ antiporter
MAMHFLLLLLVTDKILRLCKQSCNVVSLSVMFLIATILLMVIPYFIEYRLDIYSYISFILLFVIMSFWHYRKLPLYNYTALVLAIIFFSLYAVFFINHYAGKRIKQNTGVLAEKLSEQHDLVAEYMLAEVYEKMANDPVFFKLLYNRRVSFQEINNHLTKNYFSGYWTKYSLTMTDCLPEDVFTPQRTNLAYNCQDYFNDIIENGGTKIGETEFYYLDIMDGRIHYMGKFSYTEPESGAQGVFYLELVSILVTEELGYPELLLDEKYVEAELFKDYSYAKYYRDQLLASSGDYRYSLNFSTYGFTDEYRRNEGYDHYVYSYPNDNVIVISRPTVDFLDQLFSFSYIFLMFYIMALIILGVRYFTKYGTKFAFNFVSKIRMAVISILLLSLFLVGGGTLLLTIEQYRDQQNNNLSEKIRSYI